MATLGGNPWDGTEFRNLRRALCSDLVVVRAGITSRWSVMPQRRRLVTQARTHQKVQGGGVRMWGGGGSARKAASLARCCTSAAQSHFLAWLDAGLGR